MNSDIKIPYWLVKRLAALLSGQDDDELQDIYIYLQGKVIQSDLRENYNKNDKNKVELYNRNKKKLDEIIEKLKNVNND